MWRVLANSAILQTLGDAVQGIRVKSNAENQVHDACFHTAQQTLSKASTSLQYLFVL